MSTERGKWIITALKRSKRAHLLCGDYGETFCGRKIRHRRYADELGPWVPEDHLDVACPRCMEWWRAMKPKQPADTQPTPASTPFES